LKPRVSWGEALLALAAAAAVVAAMSALAGRLDPAGYGWDEQQYLSMAERGVRGNDRLEGPFVYRLGATTLAGLLARALSWPVDRGFEALAHLCLPPAFAMSYLLARRHCDERWRAALAALAVATSFSACKRILFNPIIPDAVGLLLVSAAALLLDARRWRSLAALTAVGVLCREFVAVPAMAAAAWAWASGERPRRGGLGPFLPLLAAVSVALLERALIRPAVSTQLVDPMAPQNLVHLQVLLWGRWLANDALAIASFLFPLLCVWRGGAPAAPAPPGEGATLPPWLSFYALALLPVTALAGTNFGWFCAYFSPLLAVGLVRKGRGEGPAALLFLLLLTLGVNRVLEPVPQPGAGVWVSLGFWSFWGHNVDSHSLTRLVVLAGSFVAYRGATALAAEARAGLAQGGGPGG